jgi:hypothetical protein
LSFCDSRFNCALYCSVSSGSIRSFSKLFWIQQRIPFICGLPLYAICALSSACRLIFLHQHKHTTHNTQYTTLSQFNSKRNNN